MARFQFKGLEEYALKISKLQNVEKIAGKPIYKSAEVVADEIKASIGSIPVHNGSVKKGERMKGLSTLALIGLYEGFGISKMRNDNGYINVKLGFDGYNQIKTKAFPNGQPNQLVARSAEKGTSYLEKHAFVGPAVRRKNEEAVRVMKKEIDNQIEKMMK